MSFFSVLAQAILDAAPKGEERDEIAGRLWGAHAHNSTEKGIGLYNGLSEKTQSWLRPVIQKTAAAYKRKHPREQVPNFDLVESGEYIQDLAESTSRASTKYYECGQCRLK